MGSTAFMCDCVSPRKDTYLYTILQRWNQFPINSTSKKFKMIQNTCFVKWKSASHHANSYQIQQSRATCVRAFVCGRFNSWWQLAAEQRNVVCHWVMWRGSLLGVGMEAQKEHWKTKLEAGCVYQVPVLEGQTWTCLFKGVCLCA